MPAKYPTFTDFLNGVRNADAVERARAARTAAHYATDAADLTTLLAILGLTRADIYPASEVPPAEPEQPRAHVVPKRFRRGSTRMS